MSCCKGDEEATDTTWLGVAWAFEFITGRNGAMLAVLLMLYCKGDEEAAVTWL